MKIYNSIIDYIGNTPLVRLNKIEALFKIDSPLYAKLEMFNPSHSIKIRIAKNMIDKAIKEKKISKTTTIIEPTSGNTGIGLALICAYYNLHFIAIMPENMSIERIKLLKAYNGEVILTKKELGMKGAIKKSEEMHQKIKDSFIPLQFENQYNPLAHYETTAKEIYNDLDGQIDIFVSAIGTGGTITGISKYLKEKNKNIISIGLEPKESPLLTEHKTSSHKIQGIGPNFVPKTLNLDYVDKILTITSEEAYEYTNLLAKTEGIFAGISSGCALCGGLKIAKEVKNKNIVMIFPDLGERYLSTDLIKYDM